jgi:hypothetical protein
MVGSGRLEFLGIFRDVPIGHFQESAMWMLDFALDRLSI